MILKSFIFFSVVNVPLIAFAAYSDMRVQCEPGETGYFPYSEDCRRFINCFRGRGMLSFCGPGTLFNANTRECDHPNNVNCDYTKTRIREARHYHAPHSPYHHHHYHGPSRQNPYQGLGTTNNHGQNINHPFSPYHSHHHHHHHHLHQNHHNPFGNGGKHNINGIDNHNKRSGQEELDKIYPSPDFNTGRYEHPVITGANHRPDVNYGDRVNREPTPSKTWTFSGEQPPFRHPYAPHRPVKPIEPNPTTSYSQEDISDYPKEIIPDPVLEDCEEELEEIAPEPIKAVSKAQYSPYSIQPDSPQRLEDEIQPEYPQTRSFYSEEFKCPEGFSGLMPHPDCTKFLSCANGRSFTMECSPGTRFNGEKLICDHAEKIICSNTYSSHPESLATGYAAPPVISPAAPQNQQYSSIADNKHQVGDYDYDIDVRSFGSRLQPKPKCKQPTNLNSKNSKPLFRTNQRKAVDDVNYDDVAESSIRTTVYRPHPNNPNLRGYFLPTAGENLGKTQYNDNDGRRVENNKNSLDHPKKNPEFEVVTDRPVTVNKHKFTTKKSTVYSSSSSFSKGTSNASQYNSTVIEAAFIPTTHPELKPTPSLISDSKKPQQAKPNKKSGSDHVFRPDLVISSISNQNFSKGRINKQVIRLRGGQSQNEGYLEIQIAFNVWGVVCDQRNQWSLKEADLVCKNLGYSRGAEKTWQGSPSDSRSARLMISASVVATNTVRCVGHEANLLECYISTGGDCDLEKDAVWTRCVPNSVSSCQPGEISFGGKCYSLVLPRVDVADHDLVGFSQTEALTHCQTRNSKLVDFTSQEENDFLSEWLYRQEGTLDKIMTSGVGSSVMGHSIWIWEGSSDSFSYTNWWPGWTEEHPTSVQAPETKTGRALCVLLQRMFPCSNSTSDTQEQRLCDAEYYYWTADDCAATSAKLPYICERPQDKIGCIINNGAEYSGPANVTKMGNPCLNWNSEPIQYILHTQLDAETIQTKLMGHNKCRNVDHSEHHPWCYTMSTAGIVKQLCDIPKCGTGIEKSAKFVGESCQDFWCPQSQMCISDKWVCDGNQDCSEGEDEKDCENLEKFKEHSGMRLYGYDYENHSSTTLRVCAHLCLTAVTFKCRSFSYQKSSSICALSESNIGLTGGISKNDSSWSYYEVITTSIRCHEHFQCDNGKCISKAQECNGHDECGDGSDEKNCISQNLEVELKLFGGISENEGIVHVKVQNDWGLICDDEFDISDGNVICRQLGYKAGALDLFKPSMNASSARNLTKYLIDNLRCNGNETNVSQCKHNGWGVHDCSSTEYAGVVCKRDEKSDCGFNYWQCENNQECIPLHFLCDNIPDCSDKSDEAESQCKSPIQVRLVGFGKSSKTEGRLEVRRYGVWGTVCDDDFGEKEANVICNSLGFPGPVEVFKEAKFGAGDGIIWLDQVRCMGNETSVEHCLHEGWGQTNCRHNEDVSVACVYSQTKPIYKEREKLQPPTKNDEFKKQTLPKICGKISEHIKTATSGFKPKVVSGFQTIKGSFPWQASLRVKSGKGSTHWCGAVIVTSHHVLTAAHCLRDFIKSHYFVRSGDFDTQVEEGTEQELEVEEVFLHPEFDKGGPRLNNDIAIVKVKSSGFQFNDWVQPACLPITPLPPGSNCSISGWGTSGNPGSGFARILHAAWIPTLSDSECSKSNIYSDGALSEGMLCAGFGGADSCQGDSGGPLICLHNGLHHIFGITSWGHGCGRTNSPGVYTKVHYYKDWIMDLIS